MKKMIFACFFITITGFIPVSHLYAQHNQKIAAVVSPKKNLTAWVLEDHYLPIVSIRIAFTEAGFAYDPEKSQGLAFMASSLLDEGPADLTPLRYKKQLETLTSQISYDIDEDNFIITITTLEEHVDAICALLAKTIAHPSLDKKTVERIRKQINILLVKNNEQPEYIASQALKKAVFSAHPYGYPKYGSLATLPHITKEAIASYIKNTFSQENLMISFAGAITQQKAKSLLDDHFSSISATRTVSPSLPPVPTIEKQQTIRVNMAIPQTIVLFAMPAPHRNQKDFYATFIANHIFGGGGFESRLTKEIREKNGLAYTSYSQLELNQHSGLITGYLATENKSIAQSIDILDEQINMVQQKGVSLEEVQDAKSYLIYSFPLKMTQNSKLSAFLTAMQLYHLGKDFLEKRNHYIQSVTIEAINKAAKKYFRPDKMITVIVGGETPVTRN